MDDFSEITLSLCRDTSEYFKAENSQSADYCFANIYMWDEKYTQSVAFFGDRLITKLSRDLQTFFAFPIGSGDITPAFEFMWAYCRKNEIPLRICGVTDSHLELIRTVFPNQFEVIEDRVFADYIYPADKLATFEGKHLHSKRNFCHRFESEYDWRFVPLTDELIPDCIAMLDAWMLRNSERLTPDIGYERSAILRGLKHMDELSLCGGVLFADGELVGFSVGELLNEDTFCVHFEKAFTETEGAYPMLCREMAKLAMSLYPEIRYVNREDDMGNPALRTSKLSYKPEKILMKYIVSEINDR